MTLMARSAYSHFVGNNGKALQIQNTKKSVVMTGLLLWDQINAVQPADERCKLRQKQSISVKMYEYFGNKEQMYEYFCVQKYTCENFA